MSIMHREKKSFSYRQRLRLLVLQKYGGKCAYCRCRELAALTIDHINDDGNKEKYRYENLRFYRDLYRMDRREDLQVLCSSCQWRKISYGRDFSTWKSKKILTSVTVRPLDKYTPRRWKVKPVDHVEPGKERSRAYNSKRKKLVKTLIEIPCNLWPVVLTDFS